MSRRSKSVVQIFLNLKVIVGVIFFCFLFFTVTVSLVWLTKPDAKQRNPAPAVSDKACWHFPRVGIAARAAFA